MRRAPTRRDLLLSAAGLALTGPAWAMGDTHDVSYGVGPNLEELRSRHASVSRLLGTGVAQELVIVEVAEARYALVYRRGGDLAGTTTVAQRHARLLRPHGLNATPISSGGAVVYPPSAVVSVLAVANVAPVRVVDSAPAAVQPAPENVDTALEAAIEKHVKALRSAGQVSSDEQTSWLVYDLESKRTLASINGEVSRQAASMIKPLVMLAFFHEVEAGNIVYGAVSRAKLESMIQRSSNTSTNWTMDQVGGPRGVQRILESRYGALCPHTRVVEHIASGGQTYLNRAAVGDYGRYLRALWEDELPSAKEQRRLLGLPNRDRMFHGAPSIPSGTLVLDKTGSTARCCGDMGILVAKRAAGGRFPYVFCGVIEKSSRATSYGTWVSARSNVIRGVSDLAYRHLKPRYGLA